MTKEEIQASISTLIEINPVTVTARGREITMGRNTQTNFLEFNQGGGSRAANETQFLVMDTGTEDTQGVWTTGEEMVIDGVELPYYITSVQHGELNAYCILSATQLPRED